MREYLTLLVFVILGGGPLSVFLCSVLRHYGCSPTTGDIFWDLWIVGAAAFVWFCTALTFPLNILAIWEGAERDEDND